MNSYSLITRKNLLTTRKYLPIRRNAAFWRGAVVALALSFAGSVVFAVSMPLIGVGLGARAVLIVLSFLYLVTILQARGGLQANLSKRFCQPVRGVLVSLCLWLLLVAALCVFNPSIWVWLATLVTMVWLIRCLRCYRSLFAAAADAVVNGLALFLALATALHTQSVFLSLWCFFLVQAALVFLPGAITGPAEAVAEDPEQSFDAACRAAEAALRRLSVG